MNSDAFELLVYDLLEAEGFRDLIWRGPGADGGRDIEASWSAADPVGGVLRTRWYIECKWYTDSVPFGDIEPKLLAASAARVDYLLVATSARIRNTAIDSIAEWLDTRAHPFRIRYWTGIDILRLAVRHSVLFQKHFPTITPPAWGVVDSERQRLSVLLGSTAERIAWRVLPAVQLLANRIEDVVPHVQRRADIESEVDFIASMLRAHDAFSLTPIPPSTRPIAIVDCINAAVKWLAGRGKQIRVSAVDPTLVVHTSAPLLKCALFEIILNAATYQRDLDASVSVAATAHHWTVDVTNTSAETLGDPWPVLGFRSALARQKSPSGQGLGCWIANALARSGGFNASWSVGSGRWTVRIQGART